jgi:hypothetical protein
MSHEDEAVVHLGNEIDKVINRFRAEYDISYAAVVGCLHFRIFTLEREAERVHDENEGREPA